MNSPSIFAFGLRMAHILAVSLTLAGLKYFARDSKIMTGQTRSLYPWSCETYSYPKSCYTVSHYNILLMIKAIFLDLKNIENLTLFFRLFRPKK